MSHDLFKAIHIIGAISWMAGLLYMPRLFIYDVEADAHTNEGRALQRQLRLMQRRLWLGITWPAMLLTLTAGLWILIDYQFYKQGWTHVKLMLITMLLAYHLYSHIIYKGHQSSQPPHQSMFLRIWNELATLLMVAIVMMAVLREQALTPALWFGIFIFACALAAGIWIYKRVRQKRQT